MTGRAVRMRGRLALVCVLALIVLGAGLARAHIGSPDTWFEGNAGPYPIRVVVRAPGVVPGLAEINVRVLDGSARRVTVQPYAWNAGTDGAPPPDVAPAVPGDPALHSVNLWFMVATSYGVHVKVSGDRGEGMAIVPVQAVASRRLPMDASLQWTLIALGLFLFAGLVTIVGAAVRDASLPPGQQPDAVRLRRARISMAVYAVALALALLGGRAWWDSADRANAAGMFKPLHASASVVDSAGASWVRFTIDDPRWRGRQWTPLISDHGKLMHLFLVREEDLGAIAHLHPVARDTQHFEARLPALPSGRYRVYADIVHESGFAQTLSASLDLPESSGPHAVMPASSDPRTAAHSSLPSDPDDSWFTGAVASDPDGAESPFILADGSTLTWERGAEPIVEGRDHPLRFRVNMADGTPARLEPYLGMAAHAVVTRSDGTVFAHLHPIGTVSMASQMALTMRTAADSVSGTLGRRLSESDYMSGHGMPVASAIGNEFSIPYGFPKSGRYRMWVQVKRGGAVRTAAFDVEVRPGSPAP